MLLACLRQRDLTAAKKAESLCRSKPVCGEWHRYKVALDVSKPSSTFSRRHGPLSSKEDRARSLCPIRNCSRLVVARLGHHSLLYVRIVQPAFATGAFEDCDESASQALDASGDGNNSSNHSLRMHDDLIVDISWNLPDETDRHGFDLRRL